MQACTLKQQMDSSPQCERDSVLPQLPCQLNAMFLTAGKCQMREDQTPAAFKSLQ